MRNRTWAVAAIGLAAALVPASAGAVNEDWYSGQVGCSEYNITHGLYYNEPYGWTTQEPQSSVPFADLLCPQPHFFGNNGYTSGSANVYDSTNDRNITVYLCRTTGGSTAPDSYLCDSVTTSGTSSVATGMVFPNTTDSARSYYYWWIKLPGDDTNGGSVGDGQSYFVGHFFEDN